MFKTHWLFMAAFISSTCLADASLKLRQERVKTLLRLQDHLSFISLEAYDRELEYEQRGLSIETSAKIETNLLAEKIRNQVQIAYKDALKTHQNAELARNEVRDAIEKDLALASPKLKDELFEVALESLDSVDRGAISKEVDLPKVEETMKEEVSVRREFLNASNTLLDSKPAKPKTKVFEANKKVYKDKRELVEALVSNDPSTRGFDATVQAIRTGSITRAEARIALQVRMNFLGASIDAGPSVFFKREIATDAAIVTEGLYPILLSDGSFDVWKRDFNNNIILKNGKKEKRFVSFNCNAALRFETVYAGNGGFSFMGVGASGSINKTYMNSVNLDSRRIEMPELVGGRTITARFLSEICHRDFLNAKTSSNMTVEKTLNVLMKSIVAGLVFTHGKTNCAADSDCRKWFNEEVLSSQKRNNVARCIENPRELNRVCELRGKMGQACPVFVKGKRVSSEDGEYTCDKGLKCEKQQDASYLFDWKWSPAKGKCK